MGKGWSIPGMSSDSEELWGLQMSRAMGLHSGESRARLRARVTPNRSWEITGGRVK